MNIFWWLLRSSKTELKIVLATLFVLIALPTMSIVIFASAGIELVSESLASVNPTSHLVEIFDANGHKVRELELSTVWPGVGKVTSEFGSDRGSVYGVHTGIDIANVAGTPITTFMEGKVISVDNINNSSCGINVMIDHGYGIHSLYCHMSATAATLGATVKPGDIIGYVGATGLATGDHLHFQINLLGIPVNPRTFMVGEPPRSR